MASSPPSKRRRKNSSKEDDTNGSSSSSPEKMTPVLVFAHGAGAPSSSDWMVRYFIFISLNLTMKISYFIVSSVYTSC